MPLPQEHVQSLETSLRQHEQELRNLQRGPDSGKPDVGAQIEFHQAAITVGRDEKIRAVLTELYDNPQLVDQIASNPDEFLRGRGVHLPGNLQVVTTRRTSESFMVGINLRASNGEEFSLQWERRWGFGARVLQVAS